METLLIVAGWGNFPNKMSHRRGLCWDALRNSTTHHESPKPRTQPERLCKSKMFAVFGQLDDLRMQNMLHAGTILTSLLPSRQSDQTRSPTGQGLRKQSSRGSRTRVQVVTKTSSYLFTTETANPETPKLPKDMGHQVPDPKHLSQKPGSGTCSLAWLPESAFRSPG